MPNYTYECESCGFSWEKIKPIKDRLLDTCPKCEETGVQILKAPAIQAFKPFFHDNLGTEKVYISSKGQLRDECKKRGLKSVYLDGA